MKINFLKTIKQWYCLLKPCNTVKIEIPQPTQCHLWNEKLSKETLFSSFVLVKEYQAEYHHSRCLKKCIYCGQLYFCEMVEIINFNDGNDDEYYTYIPVKNKKDARYLSKVSQFELTNYMGIHLNFPPYDSVPFWMHR